MYALYAQVCPQALMLATVKAMQLRRCPTGRGLSHLQGQRGGQQRQQPGVVLVQLADRQQRDSVAPGEEVEGPNPPQPAVHLRAGGVGPKGEEHWVSSGDRR